MPDMTLHEHNGQACTENHGLGTRTEQFGVRTLLHINDQQHDLLVRAYKELREEQATHGDHSSCESSDCVFKALQEFLQPFEPVCPKCGWELCGPPSSRSVQEEDWEWRCPHCFHQWEPE